MRARDLYHEQNPQHCLLPDPEDENGMSSHRYQCDEWNELEKAIRSDEREKFLLLKKRLRESV